MAMRGAGSRGHDALLVAAVPILLAFQLSFFDRWISFMDEGHILTLADIIADGGELYRDATTYPLPGAYYLLAAAFDLFGASNRVARWLVSIEFAVLGVCVLLVLRRFVRPGLAAAGLGLVLVYRVWSFPHWHVYTYSSTALCLLAAALVAMLRYLESGDRRVLALCGLLAGLGTLCKRDYGAAAFVALNGVLLARHGRALLRPLAWLNGPAVAAGGLVVAYFASQGLLADMLRQTVVNHIVGITEFEYSSLPPIRPLLAQDPALRDPYGTAVYAPAIVFTADWEGMTRSAFYAATPIYDTAVKAFFYLPYAIVAFGGARLLLLRGALRDPARRLGFLRELALYAFASLLLLSLNKPKDFVHMAILYWPLLCLLLVYAGALARARPRLAPLLLAAGLLAGGPALGYTGRLAWQLRERHQTPLATERGGILVTESQADLLCDLVGYVREQTEPDEPVAVFPYYPMVSFLADRRGPHPASYLIWPVAEVRSRDQVIIDAVEETGTDLVVYHFTQWNQFPRMDAYAPRLFTHLVDRFEIDRVFSEAGWGYMFGALRREPARPPGRPVLDPGGYGLRLRIEDLDREPRYLPAERHGDWVQRELWPFRRVIALRPRAWGGRTVLSTPARVPEGAILRTAVGVHPRFWFHYPSSSVRFEIAAREGDADPQRLYARTLDPHRHVPDRRWFEVEIPLDALAGRRVTLEFATSSERVSGEVLDMAGFEVPELVVREESP